MVVDKVCKYAEANSLVEDYQSDNNKQDEKMARFVAVEVVDREMMMSLEQDKFDEQQVTSVGQVQAWFELVEDGSCRSKYKETIHNAAHILKPK